VTKEFVIDDPSPSCCIEAAILRIPARNSPGSLSAMGRIGGGTRRIGRVARLALAGQLASTIELS
jgi:hypothetical protein